MSSIKYYDQNAEAFYTRTINADVSDLYEKFLCYIECPAKILDAGCGVGRDARYFSNLCYDVTAFDASLEMVNKACQELNKEVLHLFFHDLYFTNEFDAVWANASLLHVPFDELKEVLQKLHRSLKKDGIFFASFKYGDGCRKTENRMFFDFKEESILPYLQDYFLPIEIWKSTDTRSSIAPSPYRAWLNILCRAR